MNSKTLWILLILVKFFIPNGFSYISFNNMTIGTWQPIFQGVDRLAAQGTTDDGRIQKVNALRIDLHDEDIEFFTTPSNGPLETVRQTGETFLSAYNTQIGINAHFYASSGSYANLYGVAISQGNIVSPLEDLTQLSPPAPSPASLFISQDNVARILPNTKPTTDITGVWTAIESWPFLLKDGKINSANPAVIPDNIHPRSAVGLSSDSRHMYLLTIDGRQSGYSDGATEQEIVVWLYYIGKDDDYSGTRNGFNLDGGGSTHLWIAPYHSNDSYALNKPSENREVGSHLGVYAAPLTSGDPYTEVYIHADFENGSESTFAYAPNYSGSTYGISGSSTAATSAETSRFGSASQKLTLLDDAGQSNGWFVRHVSGASAFRPNNIIRPTRGYIGFWAKTADPGCRISIALDNTYYVSADRGVPQDMPADNQWHLYEWNLEDNANWEGWSGGDGIIDTADFTIDSIQIQNTSDINAVIYLDEVVHSPRISLNYLFTQTGDFEPDGDVDLVDFARLAHYWLSNDSDPDFDKLYDLATPYDNAVDITDLALFVENWL